MIGVSHVTGKGRNQRGGAAAPFEEATQQRLGKAFAILERCALGAVYADIELTAVRLKMPPVSGGESMAVITGIDGDGTPVVAFHSAVSVTELMCGLVTRLANGTLKWRVDEYRK